MLAETTRTSLLKHSQCCTTYSVCIPRSGFSSVNQKFSVAGGFLQGLYMSLAQQLKVKGEASPNSKILAKSPSSIFQGGTVFQAELSKQVSAGAD